MEEIEIPYSVSNPPNWLKNLPRGAIAIGVRTFNRVLAEEGDEDAARKAAWRNIKLKYRKVGDKWVRKTEASLDLTFKAAVHSIITDADENLATFYIMNTSENRVGWGVTAEGLEEALPTLLNKIIGFGTGYKNDKHYDKPKSGGKCVKTDMPDHYALGTFSITDNRVWELLNEGEWGPISVVISSFKQSCSKCGEDISADPWDHKCIKSKKAYVNVERFKFVRVDFIDVPAYPQAGLLNFGAGGEGLCPVELCAGFYESQSITGQAPGSPGLDPNPEEKRKKMDELEKLKGEMTELQGSIATLTTERDELKKELAELKAAAEKDPDEDPKVKELQDKIKKMEAAAHAELLEATVTARVEAGLSPDRDTATEELKDYSDAMLILAASDAGKVKKKIEAVKPTGPKTKFDGKEDRDTFTAAIEEKRDELYGYTRGADGKVVM